MLYRSMIEILLYLTDNASNISYSVRFCARFQAYPKECHMVIEKRIIKYVSETSEINIWYS